MNVAETGVTAALVGVIIVLYKIIDGLWKKFQDNKSGSIESNHMSETHDTFILMKRDVADMREDMKSIASSMAQLAGCMQKISENNKKIAEIVDKLERRQELEDEISRRRDILEYKAADK